jgi:hypothetical protein
MGKGAFGHEPGRLSLAARTLLVRGAKERQLDRGSQADNALDDSHGRPGRRDYPSQSPYVTLANQYAATLMRCGTELCLSPASRIKNLPERKSSVWENSDGSPVK